MGTMHSWKHSLKHCFARSFPVVLAFAVAGCVSTDEPKDVTNIVSVGVGAAEEQPDVASDDATRRVRNTAESVKRYEELRLQGNSRAMIALRTTIARTIDENFDDFRNMALDGQSYLHRNMAVKCLGFANERRADASEVLIEIASTPNEKIFLIANSARGLGLLRDPDTPLGPVVALMGSGDPTIRTSAATALKEIVLVKKTPRELTPLYLTALERCATMLYDKYNRYGRRAAVYALANMRHPDTFDHLVAALEDGDEQVQIGGLRGLELLGDQRAIEPLLEYLGGGAASAPGTWAIKALKAIALQSGLAKSPADMADLSDSPRAWREFFRNARMQ